MEQEANAESLPVNDTATEVVPGYSHSCRAMPLGHDNGDVVALVPGQPLSCIIAAGNTSPFFSTGSLETQIEYPIEEAQMDTDGTPKDVEYDLEWVVERESGRRYEHLAAPIIDAEGLEDMTSTALIDADMAPTLQSILDQKTLRWIFVGGKGGVGKTTTSCSLAIQLAKHRKSVLLISTDPAHNLSDAFNQKFGKDARLVNGFDNLSAMEIDPNGSIQDLLASGAEEGQDPMAGLGGMGSMMQDLAFSIPGVDEAMSFAEVLKQVKSMSYEVIIFDTAPTGHTLRFLQFPTVMEKALSKVSQLSRQFGPMLNSFLGASGRLPNGQNMDELVEKMENLRETIGEVNGQFKDADLTTFVCVCIPEFLSLYETERMIQELNSYEIDTHSIVVNQLLFPKEDNPCEQCNARRKMQKKYLDQIEELYDEFNVVKMPLLVEEVRGKEKLEKFSEMLVKPFVPPQ
ncbi:Golgi to ER traffic- protein [Alternaria ventricosa]|uniref:Golgi to ER traffic- protein n=1 Tax=Alternaria ventricosa TaxID=1187951 RepID=UPI0020C4F87D|nr:Golgi to ER traffic- protein [Alternaria ventricosa]KAI4638816.1 Golgi to ER traffic- protein [Alternaria ventricosa]